MDKQIFNDWTLKDCIDYLYDHRVITGMNYDDFVIELSDMYNVYNMSKDFCNGVIDKDDLINELFMIFGDNRELEDDEDEC